VAKWHGPLGDRGGHMTEWWEMQLETQQQQKKCGSAM
jgi:hypothetical protein